MAAVDGRDPGAQLGWRWDVALSFAGAQRSYVEQVAEALKARGVRCFYDADEQIELWGKYLAEELPAIYGEQAAAGSAADGQGTPASFSARAIRAMLCPARRWVNIHRTTCSVSGSGSSRRARRPQAA